MQSSAVWSWTKPDSMVPGGVDMAGILVEGGGGLAGGNIEETAIVGVDGMGSGHEGRVDHDGVPVVVGAP